VNKTPFAMGRLNLKLAGWWPAAISAFLLAAFFLLESLTSPSAGVQDPDYPHRAIETIVPLAFALQAAFLLAPDNDPALELLLSCPRPPEKLFLDRASLLGVIHLGIALVATLLFFSSWGTENILLAVLRWLPAGLALGGMAVFTTQVTRQGIFGMLMATLYWASSLSGGDGLLKVWRWFWPFHIYLQPEKLGLRFYLLNRLSITVLGLGLTLLGLHLLKNQDRLLGNR
jgi:hypothetical protein